MTLWTPEHDRRSSSRHRSREEEEDVWRKVEEEVEGGMKV